MKPSINFKPILVHFKQKEKLTLTFKTNIRCKFNLPDDAYSPGCTQLPVRTYTYIRKHEAKPTITTSMLIMD